MGSPVFVYRFEIDHCDEPFSFLQFAIENASVPLPAPFEPTKFRITVIKPFQVENLLSEGANAPEISNRPSVHLMHTKTFDKFEMDPTLWCAVVPKCVDSEIYAA